MKYYYVVERVVKHFNKCILNIIVHILHSKFHIFGNLASLCSIQHSAFDFFQNIIFSGEITNMSYGFTNEQDL